MLTWPEPAAQMADQRAGEGHDAAGDVAAHHQVAGIDEERNRHQRKHADAGVKPLEHHQRRQAQIDDRGEAGDMPRQKAIGVPISSRTMKIPNRIQSSIAYTFTLASGSA